MVDNDNINEHLSDKSVRNGYYNMTVIKLKKQLDKRNLPKSWNKNVLISRLQEYDKSSQTTILSTRNESSEPKSEDLVSGKCEQLTKKTR